jgi:parallel beta helix pectate lyase-like protein
MTNSNATFRTLALLIFTLTLVSLAQAQATRTWVSGTGNDANPCSRTAPCSTFAGAISKTTVNGEIDVLDSAGFGSVVITKSITIDGTGMHSSILASGTNGITVNIAVNVNDDLRTVRIRGLSINGTGSCGLGCGTSTGLTGIRFINGSALHVENTVIDGFINNGITVDHNLAQVAELYVSNTSIRNITGNGILLQNTVAGGLVVASLDKVQITNSGAGLEANSRSRATLRDCTISTNAGVGILSAGTTDVEVNVDSSSVTYNPDGVRADLGTIRVSNCVISVNTNGLNNVGGTIETFGTNRISGNTNNTVGVISGVLQS